MLEEWQESQRRVISGRGILRPSLVGQERAHRYFIKVVRFPSTNFENNKWNPSRSEYAKITYVSQGWVWKEHILNYPLQVFTPELVQSEAYLNTYLWCHFRFIEEALVAILSSSAIGGTPELPPSLEIQAVTSPIDEIRIVCRDDTAIEIQEYVLNNDNVCSQSEYLLQGVFKPENEAPVIPVGTPLEVSEPYDLPNDFGNTIPFTSDDFPPPPPAACTEVTGTVSWKFSFRPETFTAFVFGQAPARLQVVNIIGSGNITFQSSTCSGGTLISSYSVDRPVDSTGGTSGLAYDSVTCSNPAIPVNFNP